MKRHMKMLGVTLLLLLLSLQSAAAEFHILTTFYPIYVLTLNIADGIEGVSVENMAEQRVGCLHDYQLTTRDVVKIEGADALIVNGGGMEHFLDKVISLQKDLPIIDASEGIDMIWEEDEGEYNAHIWLDPRRAAAMVQGIAEGLAKADPAHAGAYLANAADYAARLTELDRELSQQLRGCAGSRIVTFHEAFAYFAERYELEIAGVIEHEPGESPLTRDVAETCDMVLEMGVKALFTEPLYPEKTARTIAAETGASVWTLDPIVSGDMTKESYEIAMRRNARTLEEALTR